MNRRDFLQVASVSTGLLLAKGHSASANEQDAASSSNMPLTFKSDGTFKIVQFTDTHWLDGTAEDLKTAHLIHEIVQFEQPDLIILTGDNISGKEADSAQGQQSLLMSLASHKIPWAIVFGNHDDEGSGTRQQLWDIATSISYSVCPKTVPNISGQSNYVLTVHSRTSSQAAYALYMIDSNGYTREEDFPGYGWIMPDQIEWFRKSAAQYINPQTKKPLPGLAFYHIPVPEYNTVWDKGTCLGVKHEDVCCPTLNSGFFAAALEHNIQGMFVGHDHVNDYEGRIAGIRLCYGRKTGFRSYGKDGFPKGARVIQLTEGQEAFKTWITVEGCRKIIYKV